MAWHYFGASISNFFFLFPLIMYCEPFICFNEDKYVPFFFSEIFFLSAASIQICFDNLRLNIFSACYFDHFFVFCTLRVFFWHCLLSQVSFLYLDIFLNKLKVMHFIIYERHCHLFKSSYCLLSRQWFSLLFDTWYYVAIL